MKGFLKRDIYLTMPNLRFYVIFLAVIMAVSLYADKAASFLPLYLMGFGSSTILGLFSYDEINAWRAYAAAAPGGRSAMVDARYLFSLVAAVLMGLVAGLLGVMNRGGLGLWTIGLYSGVVLLAVSVIIPLTYRFGGGKTRLITIIVVCAVAGGTAAGTVTYADEMAVWGVLPGPGHFLAALALIFSAVGLAAMAVSWRISRRILAKKEF